MKNRLPQRIRLCHAQTSHKPRLAFKGFTLSELLVSLGVLGLIAGLTIPSVVSNVQNAGLRAGGKIITQALASFLHTAYLNGEITDKLGTTGWRTVDSKNDPLVQFIATGMNASKICDANETTLGCSTKPDGTHQINAFPKLVFQDGSVLTIVALNNLTNTITFDIDYNGFEQGPNYTWPERGIIANSSKSDRNYLVFNASDTTVMSGSYPCKAGMLCPVGYYPRCIAIWQELYK
jgi:prepilin-type N-terminal cleavage/methylation domain-containing protein